MNKGAIAAIALAGYLVLALVLSALIGTVRRSRCARFVRDDTVDFVANRLGFVSCFCGQQGAGKSTMASGITNLVTEKLKADAVKTVDRVRTLYPAVDFAKIDAYIGFCFAAGYFNTDYIILNLFAADSAVAGIFGPGFVDDGINCVSNLENFRDYIDAFIAVNRANYTYFVNRQFYSRITLNYAMPLDYDSISIKDRYLKRDYSLYRYSCLFQDEMLLKGGANSFWESEAAEDTGISDFFRLIRHIGKKSMYFVGTSQDFNRLIKARRELFNNIFEIYGHTEVNTTPVRYWLLSCVEAVVKYLYRFAKESVTAQSRARFVGRHDKGFRALLHKIELKRKKLEARWFVYYDGIMYSDPDDYLKTPDKCSHPAALFRLYFPLPYVYGCLNTYEFSSVHDVLSYVSRNTKANYEFVGRPTQASREELAKTILAKVPTRRNRGPKEAETAPAAPYVPEE